ncbi:hypothetical protein LAUMK4_05886 [Mycobacterium persicum]|nr:hypothetical protein LAUMK4_05886 [Mycobacterium persicum]
MTALIYLYIFAVDELHRVAEFLRVSTADLLAEAVSRVSA